MTVGATKSHSKKSQGLTIALSKGKLLGPVLHLLKQAGYYSPGLSTESRKLVFACSSKDVYKRQDVYRCVGDDARGPSQPVLLYRQRGY